MNLKSLFMLAAIAGLAGCAADKQPVETEVVSSALPDGAYLIAGVTVTENGEVSQYTRDQIKIYTQGRFMYAFNNAQTESIDVGAGDATWSNGVMVEVPRVNHDGPVSGYSFDVAIDQTETGFEQTIIGMEYEGGRLLDMVEVWNTASTATSAFDGLWQLQARESNDPDVTAFAETKMIGGGHFIWLQNAVFKGEAVQEFGFGTFEVDAMGNAVETAMTSSMPDYEGTVNAVKMELIDENHFTQSFTYNGETVTQTYMRM
ncbi:MAG: hypothetical protein ACPHUH_06120 [Porticoccaceae bacterium]